MSIVYDLDPNRFLASIAQITPEIEARARMLVARTVTEAIGEIVHQIDDVYHAVDTGRLRGSFTLAVGADSASGIDNFTGVVGTNVHYAIPVHEGWTRVIKHAPKDHYGVRGGKLKRKEKARLLKTARGESKDAHDVIRRGPYAGKTKMEQAQDRLRISRGAYSYGETYNVATRQPERRIRVEGRPFVEAALPAIREKFHQYTLDLFGPLGFSVEQLGA